MSWCDQSNISGYKKDEWFAIVLKQREGRRGGGGFIQLCYFENKRRGLSSKLNQMHPKKTTKEVNRMNTGLS